MNRIIVIRAMTLIMHLISNHDAVTLMTFRKGNRLWYKWFGDIALLKFIQCCQLVQTKIN